MLWAVPDKQNGTESRRSIGATSTLKSGVGVHEGQCRNGMEAEDVMWRALEGNRCFISKSRSYQFLVKNVHLCFKQTEMPTRSLVWYLNEPACNVKYWHVTEIITRKKGTVVIKVHACFIVLIYNQQNYEDFKAGLWRNPRKPDWLKINFLPEEQVSGSRKLNCNGTGGWRCGQLLRACLKYQQYCLPIVNQGPANQNVVNLDQIGDDALSTSQARL